eukprot:scaffold60567_cov38-Prasinocladus_malaysianus.AAC.2
MGLQRHASQVRQLVLDGANLAFEGSRQDDNGHGARFHAVRLKQLVDMLGKKGVDVLVCLDEKYKRLHKNPNSVKHEPIYMLAADLILFQQHIAIPPEISSKFIL